MGKNLDVKTFPLLLISKFLLNYKQNKKQGQCANLFVKSGFYDLFSKININLAAVFIFVDVHALLDIQVHKKCNEWNKIHMAILRKNGK